MYKRFRENETINDWFYWTTLHIDYTIHPYMMEDNSHQPQQNENDQEGLSTLDPFANCGSEFSRRETLWICSKNFEFPFPGALVQRVETIVHDFQLFTTYIRDLRKEAKVIQTELSVLDSQIFQLIRLMHTDRNCNIIKLCDAGLYILQQVKDVYEGLKSRGPLRPILSYGQRLTSKSFSRRIHCETQRFVSYAVFFYYLKENKLPTIDIVASMLGRKNPFTTKYMEEVRDEKVLQILEQIDYAYYKASRPREMKHWTYFVDFDLTKGIGSTKPAFTLDEILKNGDEVDESRDGLAENFRKTEKKETNEDLYLLIHEYLIGVLYMAFQISELAVMTGLYGHGGYNISRRLANFLFSLHNHYVGFDLINGPLRRTFDRLKYEAVQTKQLADTIDNKRIIENQELGKKC